MKRRARGAAAAAAAAKAAGGGGAGAAHDPRVVMRPVQWPEERVSGGVSHAPFTHIQPYVGYPAVGSDEGVRVVSWNVCGLRALLRRNVNLLPQLAMREGPQVLCVQGLRQHDARDRAVVEELLGPYEAYWNAPGGSGSGSGDDSSGGSSARARGGGVGAGTAMFVRRDVGVESVFGGMPGAGVYAGEARVQTAVLDRVVVVNVASPGAGRDLARLRARVEVWEPALRGYVRRLRGLCGGREVVVCGDLCVAHHPIDVANPALRAGTSGFTAEERGAFEALLGEGLVDTFRDTHAAARDWYTHWPTRDACRERNVGSRRDYVLVTRALRRGLVHSSILNAYYGSEHCPVVATVRLRGV